LDVASALPDALSARTSTYHGAGATHGTAGGQWPSGGFGAGIVVSKPLFGVVDTAVIWPGPAPTSSCHDVTVVAPFQLA
jgi:hypothetical protein